MQSHVQKDHADPASSSPPLNVATVKEGRSFLAKIADRIFGGGSQPNPIQSSPLATQQPFASQVGSGQVFDPEEPLPTIPVDRVIEAANNPALLSQAIAASVPLTPPGLSQDAMEIEAPVADQNPFSPLSQALGLLQEARLEADRVFLKDEVLLEHPCLEKFNLVVNGKYRLLLCTKCNHGVARSAIRNHLDFHEHLYSEHEVDHILTKFKPIEAAEMPAFEGEWAPFVLGVKVSCAWKCRAEGCKVLRGSSDSARNHRNRDHGENRPDPATVVDSQRVFGPHDALRPVLRNVTLDCQGGLFESYAKFPVASVTRVPTDLSEATLSPMLAKLRWPHFLLRVQQHGITIQDYQKACHQVEADDKLRFLKEQVQAYTSKMRPLITNAAVLSMRWIHSKTM